MGTIILHWTLLFLILALFLWALYFVVKLAVKRAFREILEDLARKVWDDDGDGEA